MPSVHGHKPSGSISQNQKAQLANAYNELGKELSSNKLRVIGNYTLGKVIGEGAYGKVRMGTHRLTSTKVAIKQIPKAMSASLTREIHHHRQLHHPHITQMYEVIATESSIWIIAELCSGGELFDYLVEKGRLSEDETKIMFGQLCLAVAYLHDKGIVHRDLKLENVLLDERCRVKLGDFGFTREFERGVLMETFCGTTGYASPEILEGKKYNGPEVDVWSLGVILYTLLTGTLPFDDDDENIMRDKIIAGTFEDPTWLTPECRDLIKGILTKDTAKRLTIPQILGHNWFKQPDRRVQSSVPQLTSRPSIETNTPTVESSETSNTSDSSILSSGSEVLTSAPTTPDESMSDPFLDDPKPSIHRNPSETTIRKTVVPPLDLEAISSKMASRQPETVMEEPDDVFGYRPPRRSSSLGSNQAPPLSSVRTPARTKRRSISSTLSDPASPTVERTPTLPIPQDHKPSDIDFLSLMTNPAPIIFSTPLERHVLNTLNALGFDLGQIVYSVMNNACDAAGALWWILLRKMEKKVVYSEDGAFSLPEPSSAIDTPIPGQISNAPKNDKDADPKPDDTPRHSHHRERDKDKDRARDHERHSKHRKGRSGNSITTATIGIQTDPVSVLQLPNRTVTPALGIVPPTPTIPSNRPSSPNRSGSPTTMLTPSSSVLDNSRSNPSTPGKDPMGSKGRKARSGSVSIMQRATTALEAAGLVRKKSTEFREQQQSEKDQEKDRERSKELERTERKGSLGHEESRPSHSSIITTPSKLTKSPPLRPSKGASTPPPNEVHFQQPAPGSPWILTGAKDIAPAPHDSPTSASHSPVQMLPSMSTPNFNAPNDPKTGSNRHRAGILHALRFWFNEERKSKRKEVVPPPPAPSARSPYRNNSSGQGYSTTNVKRRSSGGAPHFSSRPSGRRAHRASVSSKRSSSVNSRRSSINSVQMIILDSPNMPSQSAGRRSFGAHTPNSEHWDHGSSRPSSIKSFSMQNTRHKKSPSASSTGSNMRTASPMKYHKRAGSGSSARVGKKSSGPQRPPHHRSNSATSSVVHSPASSRPTSYIEYSESEGGPRTASPFRPRSAKRSSRSSSDETPRRGKDGTIFLAQRRPGPFTSPLHMYGYGGSMGRSSWKKSWGLEPPGWQTRTTHLPVEVIAISPIVEGNPLRDVFSGRQSLSMGDESDWVDEDDDDVLPYAPGLGQMTHIAGGGSSQKALHIESTVQLSPPPRGHRTKRANASSSSSSKGSSATATGSSSSGGVVASSSSGMPRKGGRASPVLSENVYEMESRGGRRGQLPGRSGNAFQEGIQEEDEEEEEE